MTSVAANETDKEELNEVMEEKSMNNEDDDAENLTSFDEASEVNQMVGGEEVPVYGHDTESMDFVDDALTEIDEPESKSDEELWMKEKTQKNGWLTLLYNKQLLHLHQYERKEFHCLLKLLKRCCQFLCMKLKRDLLQKLSQIQDRCKLAAERILNKVENLHLQSSVQSLQSCAEN
nr:hypothetical protein CTI12_AA487690 [Tanacetum cinerariifolium]